MIQRTIGELQYTALWEKPCLKVKDNQIKSFEKGDYLIVLDLYPSVGDDYSIEEPILIWEGFILDTDGDWDAWRERMGKDWTSMFFGSFYAILVREITEKQLKEREDGWNE